MLATFLIEIFFAGYVLWRYKMSTITRLVVAILACLAVFQATEFLLCGGATVNGGTWSRLGYGAITLLPPLGLHLAHAIAGKASRYLVPLAYISAAGFITYFTFGTTALTGHTCYANYAVFTSAAGATWLFALYYYGWLLIGMLTSWELGRIAKRGTRHALYALGLGYLSFLVPTTAFNIIDPSTVAGIPSIMCGFAVILAFLLVMRVAPESLTPRDAKRSLRPRLPF